MLIDYPKDPKENLDYRIKLVQEAENDPILQAIIKERCAKDDLFFINTFVMTYDPRLSQSVIPFITYPFQDDYINGMVNCVNTGQDSCTEKSRDMWFSRMIISSIWINWFLHKWWSWLIGSYKEDYVDSSWNMDSLFEKMRFILEYLPKWMKPYDLKMFFKTISSKSLGVEIAGDAGENFGTGWRRKWVFMDEFALRPNAEKAFRKTKDITNCRIFWWTPEGRFNVYGKIMTNHVDYAHIGMKKYTLLRTMHPKKTIKVWDEKTQSMMMWYDIQKRDRTKMDLAKEVDISYDDSVTGAVYKDFTTLSHFGKYEYDPNKKLYTAQDFGRDANALLFIQKDFKTNSIYIVDAIKKTDWNYKKFRAFLTWIPTDLFQYDDDELVFIKEKQHRRPNYMEHYWDPYNGDAKTTNADNSIKELLDEVWIYLDLKNWTTVPDRIKATELSLSRIYVNDKLFDFIQSIIQSKYPDNKEWSQATHEKKLPIHNEASHYRTALEYFIDNEPKSFNTNKLNFPQYTKINKLTGKPMQTQVMGRENILQKDTLSWFF